ncbi:MAG: PspA/IM30 family protein [Geitlerinemataceae cyanobacterium]
MAFWGRVQRSIREAVKGWVKPPTDPEKILDRALRKMQAHLFELRQGVAQAVALQKRLERDRIRSQHSGEEWYRRAQLACQKGDEDLAREALTRRKFYRETAARMEAQIERQQVMVKTLRSDLQTLETQIVRVKAKKEMYVARARAAQASEQLSQLLSQSHANPLLDAFDRLEEQVMDFEARASAIVEIDADLWQSQLASSESSRDIDEELAALKAHTDTSYINPPIR